MTRQTFWGPCVYYISELLNVLVQIVTSNIGANICKWLLQFLTVQAFGLPVFSMMRKVNNKDVVSDLHTFECLLL